MLIEESIVIHASLLKVWDTFTDITCWKDWNTVLRNVSPEKTEVLSEGGKVRFCIYPFHFPVYFEPEIEEVIPQRRVVWTSGKFGITARHEFIFREGGTGIVVTSREFFKGLSLKTIRFLFPRSRLVGLTVAFLKDLKTASEA